MTDKKQPAYVVKPYGAMYGLFRTAAKQIFGYPAHSKTTALCHGGLAQMEDLAAEMNRREEAAIRRAQSKRPEIKGPQP